MLVRLHDEGHGAILPLSSTVAWATCKIQARRRDYNEIDLTPAKSRILALTWVRNASVSPSATLWGSPRRVCPIWSAPTNASDLAALQQLITEREVGSILLGNPINMRGTEGRQSVWVHEFAEALEKQTGLSVKLWDERLTSVEAGRVLRSSGISIEKSAAAVDQLSAVILLQSYLDSL